jgi:hypothetical protein
MKNMLSGTKGMHFTARVMKSTAAVITGLALGFTVWTAATPQASAQGASPARMIQAALPQGTTMATASKADLLSAVCAAVRRNPGSAPQIVRVAMEARREWSGDILRTAFECLDSRDCRLLARVLNMAVSANPDDAAALMDVAMQAAPHCADAFGLTGQPRGGDGFGAAPLNMNPPPGSIGGAGGQANLVAVCVNNRTTFVTPRAAEQLLRNNPNARFGPCQVTPITNP